LAFVGSTAAHAQGRINFGNLSVPSQKILDGRLASANFGLPIFGPAGTYQYGLYIGPAGSTAAQLTLVGTVLSLASTTTAAPAGMFSGGNPYLLPSLPGVTLDGSVPIAFMVKCWYAVDGSSFEAAYASNDPVLVLGWSTMGYVTPTISPTSAANIFGTGPGQIQGFNFGGSLAPPPLSNVPEPSSVVLTGISTAALLLLSRRK
ncbi:MAG: hypothetical protein JWR69_378, partial [Pedosphaera sp.]|nr:hypothetical protein [Pedosphaera sp.]